MLRITSPLLTYLTLKCHRLIFNTEIFDYILFYYFFKILSMLICKCVFGVLAFLVDCLLDKYQINNKKRREKIKNKNKIENNRLMKKIV